MADAITNLLSARNRLDAARDAFLRMKASISIDEKMRLFEDFVTSMKMMYNKLLYGAKESKKCSDLWKIIADDRHEKSSLMHYLWMVRNKIEHGSGAPLKFSVEAPANAGFATTMFSRSGLAIDLSPRLDAVGVVYSIEITEFMNGRPRIPIALPSTHRGQLFSETSMENIMEICLKTMIADFETIWQTVISLKRHA